MAKHMRKSKRKQRGHKRRVLVLLAAIVVLVLIWVTGVFLFGWDRDGMPLLQALNNEVEERAGGSVDASISSVSGTSESGTDGTSDSSNIDESSSELENMLAAGEVQSIRLIGDSITAGYLCNGYGASDTSDTVVYSGPEGTYTETPSTVECWANDFRSYAASRGVASFVNAGVSGFRMSYLAESPDSWLGNGADVIVVMLGTNDACKESVADFEQYATAAIAAAANKCKLLVVVSPPNNDRTDAVNLYGMDQVDEVLSSVCEGQGYLHVSLYDTLELGTSDFNPDQVHPTSASSHKLWLALKEQLGLT